MRMTPLLTDVNLSFRPDQSIVFIADRSSDVLAGLLLGKIDASAIVEFHFIPTHLSIILWLTSHGIHFMSNVGKFEE